MGARQHILVMRHPETIANARHVLSGRKDVDLTPRGERQMYQAIDAIEAWKPDRIWTSPLSRCKSIAEEAASRLKVPCRVEDGLQEMEFGSAQDLTISELSKRGLHFPWSFDGRGHSITAPGAESFETLLARARGVLDRLFPLVGRTACVTHGGVSRALLGAALDVPVKTFWNMRIANVSSQLLSCDGQAFTLCALGLAPEEVIERVRRPELFGADVADSFEKD